MRKLFALLLTLTFALIAPLSQSFAHDGEVHADKDEAKEHVELESYREKTGEAKLAALKRYANLAITNRVTSLTKLKSKLANSNVLSQNDLNLLTTQIDEAIKSLQTLKAQIEAVNSVEELETLKTMVKEIFENNKVYAVVMPKINGLRAVAALQNVLTEKLNAELLDRLQTAVSKLGNDGVDITRANAILTEVRALLASAESNLALAKAEFDAVNVSDPYATAKAHLDAGRAYLGTARYSLASVKALLEELRGILGADREMETERAL